MPTLHCILHVLLKKKFFKYNAHDEVDLLQRGRDVTIGIYSKAA